MEDNEKLGKLAVFFPAGQTIQLTPLEAAEEFSKRYFPDLGKKSISLPEEVTDHGHSTQAVFLSKKENEALLKTITNTKDREKFGNLQTHLKGSGSEIAVWNYLKKCLKSTKTAMFWSFKPKRFRTFIGKPNKDEQEFDIMVILPDYKKFIMVEIKNGQNTKVIRKAQDQLKKGKKFFEEITAFLGEDLFNDWEFVPVIALPNFSNKTEVKIGDISEMLLTKKEISDNFFEPLTFEKIPSNQCKSYEILIKILFASGKPSIIKVIAIRLIKCSNVVI